MSDSYDDYEVKIQLAEHEWEMVKTEHDRAVELGKAYERGWNAALAQQEPVAWLKTWSDGSVSVLKTKSHAFADHELEPLYTAPPKREWVGLTDDEIDALSQARSLTDELMDCVDRLGSEADTVDPRVWQHLLVYAPKPEEKPVAWMHNFIEGNVITHIPADIGRHPERWIPLYTAPPKKQWVGLTDDDVSYFRYQATFCDEFDAAFMAELIEKNLKEKNHG